jgi:uncharacterized protein (DUF1697 family)
VARYAAFLRAVNLGSVNKASKERLRELFEEAGLEDVATFRTSGNVVFSSGRETVAKLAARIEKTLEEGLGFAVPVYLRSERQVCAIAAEEPFDPALVEASKGKLQVSLLTGKPAAGARAKVLALASEDDRLAFGERELFWLPRGGTLESDLDQKAIDKLLGARTTRTMGTVEQIAKKYFGP